MAKIYYSTTPPSLPVSPVPPATLSETPTTTVTIPGDYYLKANPDNGKITLESGIDGEVRVEAPLTDIVGDTILGTDINSDILELNSKIRNDVISEGGVYNLGNDGETWNKLFAEEGEFFSEKNVENPFGFEYDPDDVFGTEFLEGNKDAANAQRREGAVFLAGGMGIQKDLNVGGTIYGRITIAQTSLSILVTSTNVDQEYYPLFARNTGQQFLWVDEEGVEGGLTYNPAQGKLTTDRILVAETDAATVDDGALRVNGGASIELNVVVNGEDEATSDTGAVVVSGGISVGKNIWVNEDAYVELIAEAGEVNPHADDDGNIGTTSTAWAEGYINELYTKIIKTTTGTLTISPQTPLTDIYGDIRVRGTNPIGTAPVVTNVLYVTVDGNDTNDGRAQDSSRACRTIGGAINSPFYQPGTQILVSAGTYLEDNPLRLKPYTSVRGSDIRTTFIEPINKTQDLFHLDSGCYLNYMTFLNGRSGLLEGPYEEGFNRGAYATAFPPLPVGQRIDLFHSPYVQNCTNQSGPWLKDGTMFIPSQTVQIPVGVGIGSWPANTTSVVVSLTTGTITQGMSISDGQQNKGFFNARTLMLANKPFVQDQVVAFVDSTFSGFEYSRESCRRDVGILVENVAYDAAFGGNLKTVESGLAYYDGVISRISGQETQTVAAIDYLSQLVRNVITNTTCTDLYAVGTSTTATSFQVINYVLTDGDVADNSIESSFDIITDIIENGPDAAPAIYSSNGPDAAYVSAEVLLQANREFIQQDTINYINNLVQTFPYSEIKCRRDTKLIVDAISQDLLYPTPGMSQSTFAGIQYWSQGNYTGDIEDQLEPTVAAITYLKELSVKIIQNITTADDLIDRYQFSVPQVTVLEAASEEEAAVISADFDVVIDIVSGQNTGWTDKIIPNNTATTYAGFLNAFDLLQANKSYMAAEVLAYVAATYPSFTFSTSTCARDVGLIVDAISYDLVHSGNRQAVQAGLYYYGYTSTETTIQGQEVQTIAAYQRIYEIVEPLLLNQPVARSTGNNTLQILSLTTATISEVNEVRRAITTITNIITNGISVAAPPSNIALTASTTSNVLNGYLILQANRDFIADEVISYIDNEYNPSSFNYNEAKCYRDVGLIVDAVSQDVLLSGNQKSVEAGLAYWSAGYNYVSGQETTTTIAINHARDIALQIIANQPVTAQTSTVIQQVINPYFQYGEDYMPQQSVARNFNIITKIIQDGPLYAPPVYAGSGIFALTGLNGADVKISPKVASVTTVSTGTYLIGLNTATIGFGNNATLYFGETQIFPLRDSQVEQLSIEYTGNASTWDSRKVDKIGSMGGSLVDGAVISDRSPIQSFVYDAYTQVNQGGRGVHIKNDGYAQLVSVFTIFCSTGVEVESGGIASIVNSNANFGNICLQARGYGKRKFTGHIYNPVLKSYPESPNIDGSDFFDQYYPTGFWPNDARVRVFIPDLDDRPHISLVMEVVPPETVTDFTGAQIPQLNEQGFPGFLNAAPTTSTLSTGSLTISGIDTTGIAVGNAVFIRDINASETGTNGISYVATGTIVTDVSYQTITLNKALTNGGGDVTNPEFFDMYFCGNSYYTVLSSEVGENPKYNRRGELIPEGVNILSTASTGLDNSQIGAHISSLQRLQSTVIQVINNDTILKSPGNVSTQTKLPLVVDGYLAESFINQRFENMIDIIDAVDLTAAENVVKPSQRTQSGPAVQGAGAAISLIQANIEFLADEISAYVQSAFLFDPNSDYNDAKCQRDVKIILQRLIYDIETGGRYNSVMSGLSYWNRPGAFHVIQLGENVSRTDLFPDGSTVNFYQRSYMSASGYVFEYVGAGVDYGALPQRGVADPNQSKEVVMLDSGKVFFTSTDQNGDFRIGPGLVISQATGVLSGRTFTRSLFANLTPFILAIESGS